LLQRLKAKAFRNTRKLFPIPQQIQFLKQCWGENLDAWSCCHRHWIYSWIIAVQYPTSLLTLLLRITRTSTWWQSVQRDSSWLSLIRTYAWRHWYILQSSFKSIENYKYICSCGFDGVFYVDIRIEFYAWVCTRGSKFHFLH
jgi:hypothetical protein